MVDLMMKKVVIVGSQCNATLTGRIRWSAQKDISVYCSEPQGVRFRENSDPTYISNRQNYNTRLNALTSLSPFPKMYQIIVWMAFENSLHHVDKEIDILILSYKYKI